jgi:hypothetical protein
VILFPVVYSGSSTLLEQLKEISSALQSPKLQSSSLILGKKKEKRNVPKLDKDVKNILTGLIKLTDCDRTKFNLCA